MTDRDALFTIGQLAQRTDRSALANQLATFTDCRVERYWTLLGTING